MNVTLPPERIERLLDILTKMNRVVIALSGGVDSAVVAAAAYRALSDYAIAVTADSPSVARRDLEDAKRVAEYIGIRHVILPTREFENAAYRKNDGARCYFCKSELYDTIHARLAELGAEVICSGANLDDMGDYRPGLKAAAERAIRHPLQEAEFTKADVRLLASQWNLPVWDKSASPCLSSRVAPGVQVTPERAAMIEQAEDYLRDVLNLRDCRVRLHEGDLARLEVSVEEIAKLTEASVREPLIAKLRELGFKFIALDLEGFRSGGLNVLVDLEVKRRFA